MQTQVNIADLDWTSFYFEAIAKNQPFQDVRIITAKSEFANKALERAQTLATDLNEQQLKRIAQTLINTKQIHVKEYVHLQPDVIEVCMNTNDVVGDEPILQAVGMIQRAISELGGKMGRVEFGEELSFKVKDVPFLMQM